MKPTVTDFLVLIGVGVILLIADRFLRIEMFKNSSKPCGVYKLGIHQDSSCGNGLRCINGFCATDNKPPLKQTNLPVFP